MKRKTKESIVWVAVLAAVAFLYKGKKQILSYIGELGTSRNLADTYQNLLYILIAILAIIVVGTIGVRLIKPAIKRKKYLKSGLSQIDRMSGEEFERYLGAHFRKQGYKINFTPKSNDFGADLIMSKDGKKTAVQVKRYNEKVGNAAIQEIVASLKYYGAQQGMVVTNSFFTKNARTLADANEVILWDRNKLIKEFKVQE